MSDARLAHCCNLLERFEFAAVAAPTVRRGARDDEEGAGPPPPVLPPPGRLARGERPAPPPRLGGSRLALSVPVSFDRPAIIAAYLSECAGDVGPFLLCCCFLCVL